MSDRLIIFLADGGMMNDSEVRGPQWQRLVADFLAPRLGRDKKRWSRANLVVAQRLFDKYVEGFREQPDRDYNAFWA